MTEKELISSCCKQNSKAQKMLYEQYGGYLMSVCLRYAGNREDAEEVFHDTMMKVFDNIRSFKGNSSLRTWINRIGINTALDFLRKRKNALMIEHISDQVLEMKDNPIEEEISIEAETAMKVLQKLPVNQQIVINLFMIDGYSHKEIANQLNISEEASRSQYSRAKKQLSELVKTKLKLNEQQR